MEINCIFHYLQAVAAAGALTDRVCIATNGKFTMPLSSEELLACCATCGNGCNGGDPFQAWLFFATNGLVTGGDYKSNEVGVYATYGI